MATVAHTIYSHYDPKDREKLEIESGIVSSANASTEAATEQDEVEWEQEAKTAFPRFAYLKAAPRFVPAGTFNPQPEPQKPLSAERDGEQDIASWYRSMWKQSQTSTSESSSTVMTKNTPSSTAPPESTPQPTIIPERRTKNNWFIQKVLSQTPTPLPSASSSSTLADILARDPPPLPSEKQFHPPVWLALGPSNKGFAMLEKRGWNEGEALGPDVIRVGREEQNISVKDPKGKGKAKIVVKQEAVDTPTLDEEVTEIKHVETIDLTLSSGESSDSDPSDEEMEPLQSRTVDPSSSEPPDEYARKALITPIPTVLKADRLGIGLKAKTVGPYKESQKRITHNAAALVRHIRAGQEAEKLRARYGRGSKGLQRQYKQNVEHGRALHAYLNS